MYSPGWAPTGRNGFLRCVALLKINFVLLEIWGRYLWSGALMLLVKRRFCRDKEIVQMGQIHSYK